jgi:hypothetical protein
MRVTDQQGYCERASNFSFSPPAMPDNSRHPFDDRQAQHCQQGQEPGITQLGKRQPVYVMNQAIAARKNRRYLCPVVDDHSASCSQH